MERIHEWVKKVVGRQMGRYWSSKEKWKVSTLWKTKRKQESLSEMRPTCQSHTDVKFAKGESASNTGPKPTNVATFAKRDRKAIGGII